MPNGRAMSNTTDSSIERGRKARISCFVPRAVAQWGQNISGAFCNLFAQWMKSSDFSLIPTNYFTI